MLHAGIISFSHEGVRKILFRKTVQSRPRLDEANERADESIAAWLAAHKERVALGMTTDGGTTTDHCDTEGMNEEVADENAPLVNGQGYVWAEGYGGRPGWVLCVD